MKYLVRVLVLGILAFHISLLVLVNLPSVQGKLSAVVSTELSKLLKTDVSIGHVDLRLFNRIRVDNVRLNDQQGENLLQVSRLSARFEWMPLFEGKIVINSVQLLDFQLQLAQDTPESVPNFQFVLDALASKDTLKEPTRLDLRINSVLIRKGQLSYDVRSVPETPGKFNASHIGIQDFNASISLKALRNDSLNATIRRFSMAEKSGLQLEKLRLQVLANNRQLAVNDFQLKLPQTSIAIDTLVVQYDSLAQLPRMTDDVRYTGRIHAQVNLADLSPFVPAFANLQQPLQLALGFQGQGKNVELPLLSLSDSRHLTLDAHASLMNWDAKQDMFLQTQVSELSVTRSGVGYLMKGLTGAVPPILQRMEHLHFRGSADGYLHDLQVDGHLRTAAGNVQAALLIHTDENNRQSYSGGIHTQQLNVGKLLADSHFGQTAFNIEVEGFHYNDKYPQSYLKGTISSLEYSDYQYHNIALDGIYKDGGFNGQLALDDENIRLNINGTFNAVQEVPAFNLRAEVREFRPNKLNLSDKYVDADLSLNLTADFTGRSVDDLNGRISLDSLVLNAPDGQGYALDNLTILAGQVDGEKELQVQSSFLEARIIGDYSYATIPSSAIHILQGYIPALVTLNDQARKPVNNFRFDVRLEDTELLRKLFYIPLDVQIPATLQGYFNDREEKLQIEGSFPRVSYNGTLYESVTLQCENPADEFSCQARGSLLMNSGAMLTLSLDAKAQDDCLKTVLNWGNNTNVTYGGKVAANTRFFKTEGPAPLLQADIDILPTTVVLNDTVWNIRSSHVAVDSGRVFVDNFLFERPDQLLRIDGRITKEPTDSCRIDLRNIDVQYVLDMVRFDDVAFGGLATGSVHLKQVLQNPMIQTQLHVRRFTVNKGLMGDADIRGVWDNELPGIRLEANIAEKGLSKTRVTGYVSPALKGLDLQIEADSTSVALLTPYVEGIFSELDARVNGDVRLYGPFKALDFSGQVKANLDAKVDVLNTYIRLRNDSVYIRPGEFALRDARLYDREGNSGRINGALRHTHLKNLTYDFRINADNLLLYDSDDPSELLFYGRIYGTGDVHLEGGNNALLVDVNLTTGRNTTFTYVTGLTSEATSNQFITFRDLTPKRIQDEIKTEFYHHTDAVKKNQDDGPPMDLYINMLVDATPDATMRVIMDPVAGDDITARGSGNFRVSFYNKGNFNMYGSYIVDNGLYRLSMKEIIRKDFTLQSGSTVTFTGDPYLANLDVQASHTVNSVSLSDLSMDASQNQSTVKVNCLMNLTGSLANPTIKFDLDLPTVNEEDRELVRSATSTEEQLNTQIIYLLGIGKFYAHDFNQRGNQSSSATSSLAFSTLSGQLNNMLSQAMADKNWNIGANLSTGQQGWSNVEAEAILSGRLLNNRLLINGNFGYRENVMANTNFVGDFEAIYLLNRAGDWRLRGYNQTNDRYFTKSTLTTQGIGLIYKKDFNRWSDLFWWLRKK